MWFFHTRHTGTSKEIHTTHVMSQGARCDHGVRRYWCPECKQDKVGGEGLCACNKRAYRCRTCRPGSHECAHGRTPYTCAACRASKRGTLLKLCLRRLPFDVMVTGEKRTGNMRACARACAHKCVCMGCACVRARTCMKRVCVRVLCARALALVCVHVCARAPSCVCTGCVCVCVCARVHVCMCV